MYVHVDADIPVDDAMATTFSFVAAELEHNRVSESGEQRDALTAKANDPLHNTREEETTVNIPSAQNPVGVWHQH